MKVRITIRLSRYQRDKIIGKMYREEADVGERFSEFKKRKKKEIR
jgi:hypothetical protein